MIQTDKTPNPKLVTHSFMVSVEFVAGETSPDAIGERLAESLQWIEGVGSVDVEHLGQEAYIG